MNQAANQATVLAPKTVLGVLIQIGYGAHLLVPSGVVGTLVKILEQSALIQEQWTCNSGEMLVSQSGEGFKMKLGSFRIYTPEQYEEFRQKEAERREAEKREAEKREAEKREAAAAEAAAAEAAAAEAAEADNDAD